MEEYGSTHGICLESNRNGEHLEAAYNDNRALLGLEDVKSLKMCAPRSV